MFTSSLVEVHRQRNFVKRNYFLVRLVLITGECKISRKVGSSVRNGPVRHQMSTIMNQFIGLVVVSVTIITAGILMVARPFGVS